MKHFLMLFIGAMAPSVSRAQAWLDPAFGVGGIVEIPLSQFSDQADCLVLQPDGKIIVAGRIDCGGLSDVLLARFESDGSLDQTFGNGGLVCHDAGGAERAMDMALQADGKIVLVGWAYMTLPSLGMDKVVFRFLPNGTIDQSFGTGGALVIDDDYFERLDGVAVDSDGRIVIVGSDSENSSPTCYLGRLNTDGTFDSTFANGVGQLEYAIGGSDWNGLNDVAFADNGRILVVGNCEIDIDTVNYWVDPTGMVGRFMSDGSPDTTFGSGGVVLLDGIDEIDNVFGVAVQSDGKVLLTGASCENCGTEWSKSMRLLEDGTRDTGFGTAGCVTHRSGMSPTRGSHLAQDNSNNVMVVGNFRSTPTEISSSLIRLLGDGTPDATFGSNGELLFTSAGLRAETSDMALQSDGKIVLAGASGSYSAWYNRHVLLLRYLPEALVGVEEMQVSGLHMISADALGVVLSSEISANAEYDVTDMLGKTVERGRVNVHTSELSHVYFASPLRNGAYAFIVRDGGTTHSMRFLVTQ